MTPDLLRLVQDEPGITITRLRERAGIGWGPLYEELQRLEDAGLLRTVRIGARRLVVPADAQEAHAMLQARVVLSNPSARRVAHAIARGEARSTDALVRALGLAPRAVRRHVARLLEHGLATSVSASRHEGLRATPALLKALAAAQPPSTRVPVQGEPAAQDAPPGL